MADTKVSAMTAATSVNSADVLYLIQAGTDKKVSISTLLANLPATLTKFSGLLALGLNSPQSVTNGGTINATSTLTIVSNDTASSTLVISNGSYEGQLKLVFCISALGTSTITDNIKATSIEFSEPGHTALLVWYSNDWWFVGGTATVNI
jgi:hypothetical protein